MTDTDIRWNDIVTRNAKADGLFFYGVRSTGVFCRPSCPSRRPRPSQVEFFETSQMAENSGYRACKRCYPTGGEPDKQSDLVAAICRHIEQTPGKLTLDGLAQQFHISPYHLQRVFKRKLGISPRQYAESMRATRLKKELRSTKAVTTAIYDAGYETSSSLYHRSTRELGMTPTQYRAGALSVAVEYYTVACQLGWLALAATPNGVCMVLLADTKTSAESLLLKEFPNAKQSSNLLLKHYVLEVTRFLAGEYVSLNIPLDVKATAFQRRVWDFLQSIPYGKTMTYRQVAEKLGKPTAFRAVAHACAMNPVALIVPCHRVLRTNGDLAGYRWGLKRKKALLELEQSTPSGIELSHACERNSD